MTKLRVALGSVYPYDETRIRGGVESATLALTRALAARDDIELHVVACHRDVHHPHTERRGPATFHWLPTKPRLHTLREVTTEAWRVRNVYSHLRPDIIHAQDSSAFAIGAPPTVPVLLTIHGVEMLTAVRQQLPGYRGIVGGYRRRITAWTMRRSIGRADALVSVGGDYIPRALDAFLPPSMPQYMIGNPVNDEFFTIPDLQVGAPPVVLCPAEIEGRKNQLDLVRAFASLKAKVSEARLILAGGISDSAYHARVIDEIARLGLSDDVSLPGRLDQAAIMHAYKDATVVALASVEEVAPMALTQALAAGRPVVATRVGGVAWIVEDQVTGVLVERCDYKALAEQLTRVLTDVRWRSGLATAGRATALQRFSGQSIAEQTVAAYKDLLSVCSAKNDGGAFHARRGSIS